MDNFADSLMTIKAHLRQKYLNEIDALHRSTAEDPETWSKLDEITAKIENLNKLLKDTEDLILLKPQENDTNNCNAHDAICCPICFEEMISPKKIL